MRPKSTIFAAFTRLTRFDRGRLNSIDNGAIYWTGKEPYANHIETAGYQAALIAGYNIDKSRLRLRYHVTFPAFRVFPNNTHGSFNANFKGVKVSCPSPIIKYAVCFDGILRIEEIRQGVTIIREVTAAVDAPAVVEKFTVINDQDSEVTVKFINRDKIRRVSGRFTVADKEYRVICKTDCDSLTVVKGERAAMYAYYYATMADDLSLDCAREFALRRAKLDEIDSVCRIKTPDETVNQFIRYAKRRASESIFRTKRGLMHAPGGGHYYAALWTNDQCEYVNPLFGYMGYKAGEEQSYNCYELFSRYVSRDKAVVSSIVAEGDGIWHGAGDRGDTAMYLYGLCRFLLSRGDKETGEKYLDIIDDCVTFIKNKINSDGVVESDSDELENRFESGKANLSTSCIAYDALNSAAMLVKSFDNEKSKEYATLAEHLKGAIIRYFGARVEGYDTFRYCKEEKNLRSWICLPMSVGINERSNGTVAALISDKLAFNGGLLSRSGSKTFWDRSALYSMRAMFCAGYSDIAGAQLKGYAESRLLGEHIPYAVEAYPEGNQAQLSAESGLAVRIITEGALGYRPTGFDSYILRPSLPSDWDYLEVDDVYFCGVKTSVKVKKEDNGYLINVNGKQYKSKGDEVEIKI